MKQLSITFPILLFLISCEQKENKVENISIDADSVLIEEYFDKTSSIEYISGYDYYRKAVLDNEKDRDTAVINLFLPFCFEGIKEITDFYDEPDKLTKYIHTIDLNNDGQLDIIYEGPSGGEPTLTEIYLQDSLSFKKIFTGYQVITDMTFSNGKLSAFKLINSGCCADPQIVEYYYTVLFDSLNTEIKIKKTIGYLSMTELLKNKFNKPKSIITKDNTKLRSEAFIFEGAEHPVWGNDGNIIGYYSKGSKGIALGNKKDSSGTWLYVLMDADYKPKKCDFPTFLEQPTSIYGWIKEEDTN